jgi:hypothetical protein
MSFWTEASGYLIVYPEIPLFGKYKDNDDYSHQYLEDPHRWVAQILPGAREKSHWERPVLVLPASLFVRWFKDGECVDDEIIWLPDEDSKALAFPSGTEGPLQLTISPAMDEFYGLVWHVTFHGRLRDVENLDAIVKWWNTLKKYLAIHSGHIECECHNKYYTDTITTNYKEYGKTLYVPEDDQRGESDSQP